MLMSIALWHLAPVGPYPVRTVYTKSRLSRKQFISRNTGFLDGLPTYILYIKWNLVVRGSWFVVRGRRFLCTYRTVL